MSKHFPDPRDPDGPKPDDIQGCAPLVWTVIVGVIILILATAMAKCHGLDLAERDKQAHLFAGFAMTYMAADLVECELGPDDPRPPFLLRVFWTVGVPVFGAWMYEEFRGIKDRDDIKASAIGSCAAFVVHEGIVVTLGRERASILFALDF